ncbi:hypothetical protein GALMADRAFT_1325497, partial [Galerina marginata CBS 339.88]
SSTYYVCIDCGKDFLNLHNLKEHYVHSPDPNHCEESNEHFDSPGDPPVFLEKVRWYCSSCSRFFEREDGLHVHYSMSASHHYCTACKRNFTSASNLNAHLNSSIHQPKDVKCPFKCGSTFVSDSALLLHLENGACPSDANFDILNRYIRHCDTKPARMIAYESGSSQDTTYIGDSRWWNGSAYKCHLCHRSLLALNQHLVSARHRDQIYICHGPSSSMRFNTPSGLAQYIESKACGVNRFRDTMDWLQMGRLRLEM